MVREFVNRELEALRRDREFSQRLSVSLDELMERLDEYPSIKRRFERVLGSLERGKSKVMEFPYTVKHFVHRGRHGWATPDTWSMDYTLAKQLEGVFREFVRASEAIVDYTEDDTATIVLEIADGFAAWVAYQDREWSDTWKDMDIKEYMEQDAQAQADALAKVRRSCELMGEHFPRFWW